MNFQERPRSPTNEAAPLRSETKPPGRPGNLPPAKAPAQSPGLTDRPTAPAKPAKKSALPAGPITPETWVKLFQADRVDPDLIRQLVSELSEAKRHNDVISLVEQAILKGQSQPWMYETLALTMELAGRPRAQIERVLLSSRDVTPSDLNSLLFLAAYLARFERYAQALVCCRQASDLEPNRPEPYLEGLRFAQRAKDLPGIAWASVGVLTYAWGAGRDEHHQAAETAAAEVRTAWQRTGDISQALELDRALTEARRRDLQIRLEFSGAGDLDLLVEEPSGDVCSRDRPYTRSGGVFAHDGYGPKPENCYDEYVCPIAWSGEYRARVRFSWGQIVGKRARVIVIRNAGTPLEQREIVPVSIATDDQIVRISLKNGRRQQVATVIPVDHRQIERPKIRLTVGERLPAAPILAQAGGGVTPFNVGAQAIGNNVGYQPVIQFFSEGVQMGAMATVSGDRRYVRINVVPLFTNITDVFTFSFVGGGQTGGGGGGGNAGGGTGQQP